MLGCAGGILKTGCYAYEFADEGNCMLHRVSPGTMVFVGGSINHIVSVVVSHSSVRGASICHLTRNTSCRIVRHQNDIFGGTMNIIQSTHVI